MEIPNIIIAIDGYSSTGKSSFAKLIAERYSFLYLDSGAMYRAITLYALEHKMIDSNAVIAVDELDNALKDINIDFKFENGKSKTYINGICVEERIRTLEISNYVSPIATVHVVRQFVDKYLRKFGEKGRVVMDGRDIGTTVFPNSQLKIFMVAADKIRAERRYKEMLSKGQSPEFENVMANLKERDYIDSNRDSSPLRQANDAIILDNSYLTMEDQLLWLECVIRNKFQLINGA